MTMIRIAVAGALILAVGTSGAVASIMLSHAALSRNAIQEFKKASELRPSAVKGMDAENWSAWWHS